MSICRASPADIPAITMLVRSVVVETYQNLVDRHGLPAPGDPTRWLESLVATTAEEIVGVALAKNHFISDLWVVSNHRNRKIGSALLSALEIQIENEGYSQARLRVVADNVRARKFYAAHGWREVKTYPHERDGHLMVDLEKGLPTQS